MTHKIIFLGPRNAGKTSLRKIFFEGETPQYLLDNPLKPTQGIENTILDLGSKIGVFDLAGQQNKQWLDTEKDIVFDKADIILTIVDVEPHIDYYKIDIESLVNNIMDFVEKIIKIQEKYEFSANIYLLIHKIDLLNLSELELNELQNSIIKEFISKNADFLSEGLNLTFGMTSIHKNHFANTLRIFIDVLGTCLRGSQTTDIDLKVLVSAMTSIFNREEYLKVKDDKILELGPQGKEKLNLILNKYYKINIKTFESDILNLILPNEIRENPLLAVLIFDEISGEFLKKIEIFDGLLYDHLNFKKEEFLTYLLTIVKGLKLEMNLNTDSLILTGENIKISSMSFRPFFVFIITNPQTNIKFIERALYQTFKELFKNNAFDLYKITGDLRGIHKLDEVIKNHLIKLNQLYKKINSIIINVFPHLYKIGESKPQAESDKGGELNLLKLNLLRAVVNQDYESIDSINHKLENLFNT